MAKRKQITTDRDLLKEVQEKFNISEKQAKHIYKFFQSEFSRIAHDDDTLSIRLPKLGTMYLSARYMARMLHRMDRNELKSETTLRLVRAFNKKMHDIPYNTVHWKKPKIRCYVFRKDYTDEELEQQQNESFEQENKIY